MGLFWEFVVFILGRDRVGRGFVGLVGYFGDIV